MEKSKIIDSLKVHYPTALMCNLFNIQRSTFYQHIQPSAIHPEQLITEAKVVEIFNQSGGSAGARTISSIAKNEGVHLSRYLAGKIMRNKGLESCQRKKHRYKKHGDERPNIPNHLNRVFNVSESNKVWCGDITYIWTTQG